MRVVEEVGAGLRLPRGGGDGRLRVGVEVGGEAGVELAGVEQVGPWRWLRWLTGGGR